MTLTLNILRCPDAVPPESRRVPGGEFSIGRGPGNDWILADPDRHLSKRHCVLAFRQGGWQLADTSTNGTFLNRESAPVGPGAPRPLRDGDRLRLGAYEIEVALSAEADDRSDNHWAQPARRAPAAAAFDDDPFAEPPPRAAANAGGNFGFAAENPFAEPPSPSVQLPSDFDPLAPAPEEAPFGAPVQADHTPALEDAFRPPHPVANLLPDDWDLDEPAPAPVAGRPPPAAWQEPPPAAAWPDPTPAPPRQTAAPAAHPFAEPPASAPPVAAPPVAAPPVAAPPVAAPPVAALKPGTPQPAPPPAPADGSLLAAFLAGAGLEGTAPADPEATMQALGAAFRAAVSGLRAALIARAEIKGEFRIEQTMIRARGNNPLKFSANDDDALAALLGTGRRVDMPPDAAVVDALRDIRLHELATMAAMQQAVRALLARLDPAALHKAAEAGVALPLQRKARAWSAFEALHGELTRGLADDFDSVFGRAFARAYEQALAEAARKDPA